MAAAGEPIEEVDIKRRLRARAPGAREPEAAGAGAADAAGGGAPPRPGPAPAPAALVEILAVEHPAAAGAPAFWMVYVRGTWFKHWKPVWTFRKRKPRSFPALDAVRTFRDRVGSRAPIVVRLAGSRELLSLRGVAPSCGGPEEVPPAGRRPLSWAGRAALGRPGILPGEEGEDDGGGGGAVGR